MASRTISGINDAQYDNITISSGNIVDLTVSNTASIQGETTLQQDVNLGTGTGQTAIKGVGQNQTILLSGASDGSGGTVVVQGNNVGSGVVIAAKNTGPTHGTVAIKSNDTTLSSWASDGGAATHGFYHTFNAGLQAAASRFNNGVVISNQAATNPVKVFLSFRAIFPNVNSADSLTYDPQSTGYSVVNGSDGTIVNSGGVHPQGVNKDIDIGAQGGDGANINFKGMYFRWAFPFTLPSTNYMVVATAGGNDGFGGNPANPTHDLWNASVGQHDTTGCTVFCHTIRQNGVPFVGTGINTMPENPLTVSCLLIHTGA